MVAKASTAMRNARRFFFSVCGLFTLYPLQANTALLESRTQFIPEIGGALRVGRQNWFFVGRGKKLQIFDASLNARTTLDLSADTAAFDFSDIDHDGKSDLIEYSQRGVIVRFFKDQGFLNPQWIIKEELALPSSVENLDQAHLVCDFDGDGFIDFFLPAQGKFFVYQNKGGKTFTKIKTLLYNAHGSFTARLWKNSDLPSNTIRSTVLIPQPQFVDFNGDGVLDVALRIDERIYYFTSQKSGDSIQPFGQTQLKIYPVYHEGVYISYSEFVDLDKDGKPDLIYSAVRGLGLKVRVDVQIFFAKNGLPDQRYAKHIAVPGGVFSPLVATIDGRKLLMVATVDTGIGFFTNYILRSRISLSLKFYDPLLSMEGALDAVSLSFAAKDSAMPGFAYGDFTRDGQTDFAMGTDKNEITVFEGNKDLTKEVYLRIPAPAFAIFRTVENSDRSLSLFVYMTQKSLEKDRQKIFVIPIKPR